MPLVLVGIFLLFFSSFVAAAAAQPAVHSFKDCPDCPEMVPIPAGSFVMGVVSGEEARENLSDQFRHRSEPAHTVKVSRFAASKFEVTRAQYRTFAESTQRATEGCFVWTGAQFDLDPGKSWRNPGYVQDDVHPVSCVSWEDAAAYTTWLSARTGKPYRLLSEAEWEYAARGGTATTRFWGDESNAACEYANGADESTRAHVAGASTWAVALCNDKHAYTAPAGSFRPNAFGLYDVLGNVEEWTQDCWNANYSTAPVDGTAAASGDCGLRIARGGSWHDGPVGVRAAYRVGSPTTIRVYSRGFRIARDM
jgi:formylglycine-generating enzyme